MPVASRTITNCTRFWSRTAFTHPRSSTTSPILDCSSPTSVRVTAGRLLEKRQAVLALAFLGQPLRARRAPVARGAVARAVDAPHHSVGKPIAQPLAPIPQEAEEPLGHAPLAQLTLPCPGGNHLGDPRLAVAVVIGVVCPHTTHHLICWDVRISLRCTRAGRSFDASDGDRTRICGSKGRCS